MSQNKVYMALKEIGGEGTTTEIREHLAEKFPNSTLPHYTVHQLRNLENKDIVDIDDNTSPFYVRIIDHNWEGIQRSLAYSELQLQSKDE
ncbi:hypothetical protein [Halorubrum yunnanense]|uniref:Uncharacterized protein n=1 Tax=Halorubrum yunnanense TaxID=1526162 RepID=A0ABD5YKY0_9EURY|nr:hypothetical protein [Halorubrum yunnanense]